MPLNKETKPVKFGTLQPNVNNINSYFASLRTDKKWTNAVKSNSYKFLKSLRIFRKSSFSGVEWLKVKDEYYTWVHVIHIK